MKLIIASISLALGQFLPAAVNVLPPAELAAAFKAAGFKLHGSQWRACEDPSTSYVPGAIDQVADLNWVRRPEVVISEGELLLWAGRDWICAGQQAG